MRIVFASILAAAAIALAPLAAKAHSTRGEHGLAGMHKLHMEKGRLCMADHPHFGQTGSWPTLKMARAKAVKSWSGFTRLEYGDAWASFRVAVAKKFDCSPTAGARGQAWTCTVEARPLQTLALLRCY